MPAQPLTQADFERSATGLAGIYFYTAIWYLAIVAVLWTLGIEAIYQHLAPFYALVRPAFASFFVPGAVIAMAVFVLYRWRLRLGPISLALRFIFTFGFAAVLFLALASLISDVRGAGLTQALQAHGLLVATNASALGLFLAALALFVRNALRCEWFDREPTVREARNILLGLFIFSVLFPVAIAMTRGGFHGVTQAYERFAYEYISDIGKGRSIRGLFAQYNELHPYLSMHAKVHPPGPIVILWLMSYLVGQGPAGLSIATIAFGALGIVPLYFWARDLTSPRCALTACALYALMPTIVLFTATSTDIAFMPFTITTLFLFWRAVTRGSIPYAVAAGAAYALMSLISFSLIGVGVFFGFTGIWLMKNAKSRRNVIQTAALMLLAAGAVHGAVRGWSGFDVIECFNLARAQFELDQVHLDEVTPRFPAWTFRFWNPACWFFFAGIPVSILFIKRLLNPEPETRGLFVVFGLTLLALDILYLGRGEGERSAMYIMPFLAIPAGHYLDQAIRATRSLGPLLVTTAFLGFQCWCIEVILYTYW